MTIHKDTKTLGSLETSAEAHDLVEEMQDVLRLDELFGIAEKHLKAAYDRGRDSVFEEMREGLKLMGKENPL